MLSEFVNGDEAKGMKTLLQETHRKIALGECDGVKYVFGSKGFCVVMMDGTSSLASFHAVIEAFEGPKSAAPPERRRGEEIVPFVRECFKSP